jgi:polyhydroxybutyrate depolymerase
MAQFVEINAVVDDMSARYNVDPKRIFVAGYSNGAFMAHRLACDLSERIAAIVSVAGAVWADPSKCRPTQPVAVAELHGTTDPTILFDSGAIAAPYPGAKETVAIWAAKNGCSTTIEVSPIHLDLDTIVEGAETTSSATPAARPMGPQSCGTATGSTHSFYPSDAWAGTLYDFLAAHPKP